MSAKLKEPGRLLPDMTEVYVSEASAMERVFDSFIKDCGLSDLSQMNTLLEKINLLSQRMAKLGTCEIAPHSLQRRCSSVRNDKEVLKRRNIDLAAMDREMEALSCGIHSHSEDLKSRPERAPLHYLNTTTPWKLRKSGQKRHFYVQNLQT
uniref:Protein MIS12 homolog n=1 Tax=Mesocestoides corti TaxID=53468 RepID=A0A5K3FFG7_MESCO